MSRPLYIILFIIGLALFVSALLINVESSHSEIIEKMKMLLLQLAVILFFAKLGGEFFSKVLHQPSVLGELLAGVFIGPFALGALPLPILGGPLFPLPPGADVGAAFPVSPELYGIATLASVILLFLAGLETDFNQFMKQSFAGTLVGMGGVAGAFVLGDLLTVWFGFAAHFMHPVALFMGTISVATSVGITARVLSEQKAMDTPEGTTILAGAVIDDVLGILILAVVVGMVGVGTHHAAGPGAPTPKIEKHTVAVSQGPAKAMEKKEHPVDWGKIGLIGYKAFGFWIGATMIGILLATRIQWFLKAFKNKGTMTALGLGLALLLAGMAEMVGLAAIIGAYAMGLALSKEKVSEELEHAFEGLYSVLVPVFFCVMGMLVNVSAMVSHKEVLIFSVVYSLVAVVSKIIGCGLPTYLVGFNTKGAMRIGIGMLPRGEVALIVAGVGLAGSIINLQLFGAVIAMTLITTLMAPPLLVKLFDGTPGMKKKTAPEKEGEVAREEGSAVVFKPMDYSYTLHDVDENLVYSTIMSVSEAFEKEGYDAKVVAHDPPIYRAVKQDIAVEMHQEEKKVRFDMPDEHKKEIRPIVENGLKILKDKVKLITLKKGE